MRNFTYITYYDGWDGAHPRVFTLKRKPYVEFESGEEINNWLLTNPEVLAFIDGRRSSGVRPKIALVFFDAETERICEELGYDLILPSAELREHLTPSWSPPGSATTSAPPACPTSSPR